MLNAANTGSQVLADNAVLTFTPNIITGDTVTMLTDSAIAINKCGFYSIDVVVYANTSTAGNAGISLNLNGTSINNVTSYSAGSADNTILVISTIIQVTKPKCTCNKVNSSSVLTVTATEAETVTNATINVTRIRE